MSLLEMAEELDEMERSLNSWEANFLDDMLKTLRADGVITGGAASKLKQIYEQYLGPNADEQNDGDDDDVFA